MTLNIKGKAVFKALRISLRIFDPTRFSLLESDVNPLFFFIEYLDNHVHHIELVKIIFDNYLLSC